MTEPNFISGTVWTGDNLPVLRGMNSECVDLIYLDPPFNSNRNYEAPIGSKAAGAAFKDMWTLDDVDVYEHGELADRNPAAYSVIEAAKQSHGKGMMSYLIFMAVRLMEMHRVLKETGSIYLHCDPTASHYLKLLMDGVFGKGNFRNEIVWKRTTAHSLSRKYFAKVHDLIYSYAKSDQFTWNPTYEPYDENYIRTKYRHIEPRTGRRYRLDNTTASGNTPYEVMGVIRPYRFSPENMKRLIAQGRIVQTKPNTVPQYKRYLDEMPGILSQDTWTDILALNSQAKERLGYPTQKPLALLDRIIKASSNEGDLVLDPFCGCATALVAADRLNRKWAGIDLSELAVKLVNDRIVDDRGPLWGRINALTDPPRRTDLGNIPNYRTHKHKLYGEQEGVCKGCNTHFPFKIMEVDHILPSSKGGTDHIDNLQLLCTACNKSKGSKTMAQWRALP